MSWFKIDDGFHSHPKTIAAGNEAIGLWARCGSYCSQHLTGGRVPRAVALMYGDINLVDTLVKVGLFEPIDDDWLLHDFYDYNPTKEKVLSEREAAARRQREARERAKLAREAAAAKKAEEAARHAMSHGVTNGVSHEEDDTYEAERHGVTYDASTSDSGAVVTSAHQESETAHGIAPVQNIVDAPSRRDSQQQSRAPRPDPTRPVLPTEVREEQKLRAASEPAAVGAVLPESAPAARGGELEPGQPMQSAQTLIAEWIDYRTRTDPDNKPPRRTIGQVSKEIKQLLDELSYEVVREGFMEWDAKGANPSSLASFVNQVQSRRVNAATGRSNVVALRGVGRPSTTDLRVAEVDAAVAAVKAQIYGSAGA